MREKKYASANKAKANFDDVYVAPTPHAYIATMAKHGFEIGEQARPYCLEAVNLLDECNGSVWPVQMLDVGCSYGIGAAFVKYRCSFNELVTFFASRAPKEYKKACEVTRRWLQVGALDRNVRCVGLDVSGPAVRFALDAGLLDGGIVRNFDEPGVKPTSEEISWFRSCNLLISTGVVGYITDRALDIILEHLGKEHPAETGPFAVITILRMFDPGLIQDVFEKHSLILKNIAGIRLPQRRFTNERERAEVLALLHKRGLDTRGWEDKGTMFADLFVAAPQKQLPLLLNRMKATRLEREPAQAVFAMGSEA